MLHGLLVTLAALIGVGGALGAPPLGSGGLVDVVEPRGREPGPGGGPDDVVVERNLFPGRTYDADIPSPTEHLGYGPGHYHTDYPRMAGYFRELERRSERIVFEAYGTSYERRPLYVAFVSSPANLARRDEIRADLARLADPRGLPEAEAQAILDRTPAVVFLNYGTHGNETAAFEASFHTAYQLVAATDEATSAMLDELVVLITPALSPDTHERFVAWYNAFQQGVAGDAAAGKEDPAAAEHFAPWGVDTNNNHYQINPNRDAAWSTQVETQALVRLYMDWSPQVFVDHHGSPEEFIGPWNAEPINPRITDNQRDWMVRYGEAMAADFRARGYRYNTWEFGLMYPGYWDSFPLLNGAIAFTLESGGAGWKGLRLRLPGGHLSTFEDGVVQNIVADDSLLRLTAAHRRDKLADYLEYRRSAVAEGRAHPLHAYAFPADADPQRLESAVGLLVRNGIEVVRTLELAELPVGPDGGGDAGAASTRLPAGSFVVPLAQPQSRLLRVLMASDTEFPPAYLERVREIRELARTPGFLNPNIWSTTEPFYDVTAWSLPLTYDLEVREMTASPGVATEPVEVQPRIPGRRLGPDARHAYVFDYDGNRAIAAMARLRRWRIPFHVASSAFRVGGKDFGRGAVVVFRQDWEDVVGERAGLPDVGGSRWQRRAGGELLEPSSPRPAAADPLERAMARLVEETGITLLGVDSNLSEAGPHLGSDQFVQVAPSRIAVVRGGPVRPSSYGAIWFLCERLYGVEFTALEFDHLLRTDLRDYGVIVLPDGFYSGHAPATEAALADKLRRWVRQGGSLVALKGAAAWLARPGMGLTSVRTLAPYVGKSIYMTDGGHPPLPIVEPEGLAAADTVGGDGDRPVAPADTAAAASAEQLTVQTTPMIHGTILRARAYPHHYLSYGYEGEVPVMMWSNLVLAAPEGAAVAAPLYFAEAERLRIAGFAFEDSLEHLAGTGYLLDEPLGEGHVVLFADDPNFRLFWHGLTRLFFNAVLLSNSF